MAWLIAKKLIKFVGVLLAVTFFATFLLSLQGNDVVDRSMPLATAEQKAAERERLGLNDPLPVRWAKWVGNAAQGDLGRTPNRNVEVSEQITNALPWTIQLVVLAQLVALVIAIPLGVWSAQRANGVVDKTLSGTSFFLIAIPTYVLAIALSVIVGSNLGWLPPSGFSELSNGLVDWLRYMILPTLALAAGQIAIYQRLLRSDLIATLQSDFITTARSKGISSRRILWRHALRPSSFSLLTVAAINTGALIGGAVVIELLFGLPGMGKLLFDAAQNNDFVTVQGCVAVIAIGYVTLNLVVDLLYTLLDPRTRNVVAA